MAPTASDVIYRWKGVLESLVALYDRKRRETRFFALKLYGVFFVINVFCYWWAMITAFPELTFGPKALHYVKMQVPLGLLAAAFEMISFHLSLTLIRWALRSRTLKGYLVHLSLDATVDIAVGVVAALWSLLAFTLSSWFITTYFSPRALVAQVGNEKPIQVVRAEPKRAKRHRRGPAQARSRVTPWHELVIKADVFTDTVMKALTEPWENLRHLYFGLVLTASELIPTLIHLFFASRALLALGATRLRPVSPY